MHEQPLVSIIIPTYNRAHLIGETLDSVLAQTYTRWECIVVDDGSTDATDKVLAEYVAKDSRFQYHHRPKERPKGANACRNYGFELSRGEFVNWFDDDDIMLEHFLQTKISHIDQREVLHICGGYQGTKDLKDLSVFQCKSESLYKDYVLWNIQIFTPSVLFRRCFLENKNLFNTELHKAQEAEFLSRIFFALSKCCYSITQEPLFIYRQHEHSKSQINRLEYNKKFKYSEAFFAVANISRAKRIRDVDLIEYFGNFLINACFRAVEKSDKKTFSYIKWNIFFLLKPYSTKTAIEFLATVGLLDIYLKRSYRLEKRWRHFNWKTIIS
ncbi:glycosyltransferase family 2 protein [Leeuwenhoekiella sp. UBA6783]|uniref:glycosyltransferase family 2 protein n=1 Tax=Leeuwenhoekiella sp. UBA6783 TaxID=1946747 RepID=UPI0025BE7136|nr:glycosyltransferase family A protein [Leeuwenhoekiella sp. UBA6783]|tara:strand:+ start:524 stop:1504 length:981 start_codon:yes stop_codon:yes gene_type:complete